MGDIALPSRDKLRALASALHATLDDLLQAAGFLDAAPENTDLPDLKAYLRRKYAICNPHILQAVETIVTNLQKSEPPAGIAAPEMDTQNSATPLND